MNLNNSLIDDEKTLYCWEITNLDNQNLFTLENRAIHFFDIKKVKEIKGIITDNFINFQEKIGTYENQSNYLNINSFRFTTDDSPVEKDKFLIYSKTEKIEKDTDFYYIESNSAAFDQELNELIETKRYEITFQNLKTLKNINENQIFFSAEEIQREKIENIKLEFDNHVLFNEIRMIGDLKEKATGKIHKNIFIPIQDKNNSKMICNYVNPISVSTDDFKMYFSNLSYFNQIDIKQILGEKKGYITFDEFLSQDSLKVLRKIIYITKTLTSNYENLKTGYKDTQEDWEEKIKKFKSEYYSGNDPLHINDFLIENHLKKLRNKLNVEEIAKFKVILLALSSEIKSKYCWGGGLTSEHKLYLPFYLNELGHENSKVFSELYDIDNNWKNKIKGAYNRNVFTLEEKIISLPRPGRILEEQNISNSPVDYNQNSFNLNYIFWTFVSRTKDIKGMWNFSEIRNTTTNIDGMVVSGNFSASSNWDARLRQIYDIPAHATVIHHEKSNLKYKTAKILISETGNGGRPQWENREVLDTFDITVTYKWTIISNNEILQKQLLNQNYIFENHLDWKKYLITRDLSEFITLNLELEESYKNEYEIINVKKINISSIFGKDIYVAFNDEPNKRVKLNSSFDPKITETKIIF